MAITFAKADVVSFHPRIIIEIVPEVSVAMSYYCCLSFSAKLDAVLLHLTPHGRFATAENSSNPP